MRVRELVSAGVLFALAISSIVVVAGVPSDSAVAQRIELEGETVGEFGDVVDIDGNLAIVGDPGDGEGGVRTGAASIFRRTGTNWALEQKLLGTAGTDGGFAFDVAISDGLALTDTGLGSDTVSAPSLGPVFEDVRCPAGSVITGFDVVFSSQAPDPGDVNWPRRLTPKCAPLVRAANADVVIDAVRTEAGPTFNDPSVPPAGFADGSSSSGQCPAGQVVVGFSARAVGLVDGLEFRCGPLAADGTIGSAVGGVFAFGNVVDEGPFDCPVGQVATGLSGSTGDDINSVSLTCSTLDVTEQTAYVGAPFDDSAGTDAGLVEQYGNTGIGWTQGSELVQCRSAACTFDDLSEDGLYPGEYFGYSVDVDDAGRRLAIGAPGGNQAFVTTVTGAGPGGPEGIGFRAALDIRGLPPGQFFGASVGVAPDGGTVVVGSPDLPGNDDGDPGAGYVFKRDNGETTDWNFVQQIVGAVGLGVAGPSLWTFGDAVDINERFVVVGQPPATRAGDRAASSPTGFLVWDHADGFPIQSRFFNQAGDEGKAVALGDDTLHVGIPGGPGGDPTLGGIDYYELDPDTDTFDFLGNVQLSARLGDSVAADNGTVISGRPLAENGGVREGQVLFYSTDFSSSVQQIGDPVPLGTGSAPPTPDVRLGLAVSQDGNRMAVSAPDADLGAVDAGGVYIYERPDAASPWALVDTIASPSPESEGRFGDALDLRGDLLAVGESDRLGDSAEPGRVWVFELDAGAWSVVGGGFFTALPLADGDHFGASLAWIDDARLAVGAPGENSATGQVLIATLNPGETPFWSVTDLSTVNGSQGPLDAGDQLGYAVAFDDSSAGDGRLVAGAPGASRRYSWTIPPTGPIGNPGLAQFDATWNMGSAVDISGNRVVTAGFSDELRVNVNESTPIQRSSTTAIGAVLPPNAVGGAINDYVDIEGTTVAVSRGGGGGQVELYRLANGSLALSNPTTYDPGSVPGDLLGFAVDLQGRSLIAGAPGANAEGGAVLAGDIGVSAVYTGPFNGDPLVPANWDLGVVPGPDDTAIIDGGTTVLAGGDWTIGRLELRDPSTRLEMQSSTLTLAGVAGDDRPSVVGLQTLLNIDSQPSGGPFAPARLELVGSDLLVEGDGTVARGRLLGDSGTFAISAGRTIQVAGEINNSGLSAELVIEIAGPGGSTDNFGRLELLDGVWRADLSVADLQIVDTAEPGGISGEYEVLTCATCTGASDVFQPPFVQGTAGLTAVRVGKGLTLFTGDPAFTATWIGEGSSPFFGLGDNWDTGIAPSVNDTAVIPPGFVDVEIFDDNEVARLELNDSTVSLNNPSRQLRSASTALLNNGEIFVGPGTELVLSNDVLLDGFIQVAGFGSEGLLTLDGDVMITGDGELNVAGDLRKTGAGVAMIDVGNAGLPNAGVFTGPLTNIAVTEGVLEFTGADLANGRLDGEALVAAGAQLAVNGDLTLSAPSSIGVDIDGDADTTDNFGQFAISGAFAKGGELFVNDNGIVAGDSYEIITFDTSTGSFDTVPAGLTTVIGANNVTVTDSPCTTSWIGSDGGLWSNPANWTNGVPTTSDVVCLDGTGEVVIDGSTNASVDRFEIADQRIRIDAGGALTVNGLSFLEQGIEVNGVLTGVGDVVLRGSSTVTGLLDGLVSVDNGATLVLAGGAFIAATAPANDVINLGSVVVTAPDLLLGDGVTISNEGEWIFGLPGQQDVTAVSAATFDNRATLDLRVSEVTVAPGVALQFGPTSVLRTTIDGPAPAGEFGRLTSAGIAVDTGAELVTDGDPFAPYMPTIFDVYTVLDCGPTACSPFTSVSLLGDLEQFVSGGDLVLAVPAASTTTFVNPTVGASWTDPANWSDGVPGPGDTAIIPASARVSVLGTDSVSVDDLVVAGQVFVNGTLAIPTGGSLGFEPGGIVFVENGSTLTIGSDVDTTGGQLVVRSAGTVRLLDGVDVTGSGELSNSGTVDVVGAVSIADPVVVTSGRESVIGLSEADLDVQTTSFDARGALRVDPASTVTLADDLVLRPSSRLTFVVDGTGDTGTIAVDRLTFTPFPDLPGGPDPDQSLATFELDPIDGSAPAGPITVITCTDCTDVDFDEFLTGDYDVIVGTDTVDVAIIENKIAGAAGSSGFGSSVSVDGDRAVVGSGDGVTGPSVLERSGGVWSVVQQLTEGSSVDVVLDGDQFIADGILYAFTSDIGVSGGFEAAFGPDPAVPGGTVADLDGGLGFVGDAGAGTAEVFDRGDFENPLAMLAPAPVPASYGSDVAVVDLGEGDALAVVSAPDVGEVYVFELAEGAWNTTPVRTLSSPDGGDNRFGDSIAISATALVVGEPFNGLPNPAGGAAWVYPLTGSPLADTPIKLTPTGGDTADVFGSAVDIDGDIVVVGAQAAQKLNFPMRDGAAYVFQNDGSGWVQTDELRAPDGFNGEFFGSAVAVAGTDVVVGAQRDRNSNGPTAGAVYDFTVDELVTTTLDLSLGSAAAGALPVAASVAISDLDRLAAEGDSAGSTLTAASLQDVAGDDPAATALSQIAVGALPLTSIVLDSDVLSAISLANIEVEGGWGPIIAGSELVNEPFASLTFGQVLSAAGGGTPEQPESSSPAGRIAVLPLTSIDVDGTPLTSIPLTSIALGETPLTSIGGIEWCDFIGELFPDRASCEAALAELTLLELSVRGVPLTSIPLTSIPLTSIDLSQSPLTSIPLTSVDLSQSPLTSIPLTSIGLANIPLTSIDPESLPLTSIPLTSIPLTSIPAAALPLTSIPLTSIPLTSIDLAQSPLTSIPLTSIPLTSIGPDGTPLTSIGLQGAPLTSIPLTSIVLADTPLTSIPLTSVAADNDAAWCAVLAEADAGFDCGSGADPASTTLRELFVRGLPLTSIPLTSIPLTSIDLLGAPLTSVPLTSVPLTSIPLTSIDPSAVPLTSIAPDGTPLTSILLTSIPLTSIDLAGTPLTSVPLTSIDPASLPLTSVRLQELPLTSVPLTSVPLTSIGLAGVPLTSIAIAGTPLTSIPLTSINASIVNCTRVDCERATLGDAARAEAIFASATLADIQSATGGIRLGEIVSALPGITADTIDLGDLTLADLIDDTGNVDLDGLVLGDLPLAVLEQLGIELGDLGAALAVVTYGDLLAALTDPATGLPFENLEADFEAGIAQQAEILGDLDTLGDVTFGEFLDGLTEPLTLEAIEPILGFITVQSLLDVLPIDPADIDFGDADLGALVPDLLGAMTLGDILAEAGGTDLGDLLNGLNDELANYTLGDLLLALVDPSSLALGGVDFADVSVSALPEGTSPATTFEARFTVSGSGPQTVDVRVELPAGASYLPGTARVVEDPDAVGPLVETALEPAIGNNTLTWRVSALPGVTYAVEFDVVLGLRLGVTSLGSTARVVGSDVIAVSSTNVEIVEGSENNDFPPPDVTDAAEGFVYLTYIASPTDNDVYRIVVGENDRLFLELSNLDANLDVALYADVDDAAVGAPLVGESFVSPDAPLTPITDPDADGAAAEPLDDFRRLDAEDPDLELIEVSNSTGIRDESLATGRLRAGTYYVQVYGANGATNQRPAALQLQIAESEEAPVCQPLGPLPTVTPGDVPTIGAADTLILFNESRLEQLYGAQERADVVAAVDRLVTFLAADPTINPVAVPVDAYGAVSDAYAAWDTDPFCDPESANDVVAAINAEIIDPFRDQLEHVVILGADEQIPMARLLDSTAIANEYDFKNEFDGDLAGANPDARNAFTSSFWDSRILSDEPYGDSDARSLGNRFLYVTDIALGRVVESPSDIVSALDTFVEFNGNLAIETAAVLGYDFLVDGSQEVADNLAAGLGDPDGVQGLVDQELVDGIDPGGELWDRVDATEKLAEQGTNALVSLNAHFDHYRALPAIGDKVPGFNDNLIAEDVAEALGPDALLNSLIFSMGCHSGLSVSDITIAGTNTDWAEVLSQQRATYIGNTGFGYGDTEVVAYSERLMANFARRVTAPLDVDRGPNEQVSTVGQALAWAKNDYISGLANLSVYDEKASMEATFYGLPFYRVGLEAQQLPDVPVNDPGTDDALSVAIDTDNTENVTPSGTYYSNVDGDGDELVIVAPGRPIQPKSERDISVVDPATPDVLAEIAHGAVIESMESTYLPGVDPVVAAPIFDEAANQVEPEVGDTVFPVRPLDITTSKGPEGERQQLVVATGQFDPDGNTQRLDDGHDITVYYSDSDDFTPPTIGAVTTSIVDGVLTIDVPVRDADSSIARVVALVAENPGLGTVEWSARPLTQVPGTDRWSASVTLLPETFDVEFIVQALDGAGNVAFAAASGENFGDVTLPVDPEPDPANDLLVTVTGTEGQSGVFDGPVTVGVTGSVPIQISIDGQALQPIASGDSIVISDGGPHTYLVVTDGQRQVGEFVVDADDEPDVEIRNPANDDATFPATSPQRFDVQCRDETLASCVSTLTSLDGATSRRVGNAGLFPAQPGRYRLDVVATDRVGNTARAARTFTIAPTVGAPVLEELVGPNEPQAIDVPVEITATFGDPSGRSDDYSVEVDWGDGTSVETIAVDPVDEPTATMPAVIPLSRLYAEPGVYTVSVTVTDSTGRSDSGRFEFVVVFDPDTRGRVAGKGFYWSGPEAHSGSPWFGSPAYFGYNARYRDGADVPSGRTKLKLVGEFFFRSTSYDYLIVNDSIAIAEGIGTTGGDSTYRFRVQGIDNRWVDFFQITIWDDATGEVLYDNGVIYDDGQMVGDERGDRVLVGGLRIRS